MTFLKPPRRPKASSPGDMTARGTFLATRQKTHGKASAPPWVYPYCACAACHCRKLPSLSAALAAGAAVLGMAAAVGAADAGLALLFGSADKEHAAGQNGQDHSQHHKIDHTHRLTPLSAPAGQGPCCPGCTARSKRPRTAPPHSRRPRRQEC